MITYYCVTSTARGPWTPGVRIVNDACALSTDLEAATAYAAATGGRFVELEPALVARFRGLGLLPTARKRGGR